MKGDEDKMRSEGKQDPLLREEALEGYKLYLLNATKPAPEKIRSWTKKMIASWRKLKPDYVFLTETSAFPYGYLFKEAWKKAYPNEEIPRFYRIDPEMAYTLRLSPKTCGRDPLKLLKRRIKKDRAKILIYDEGLPGIESIDFMKYDGRKESLSDLRHSAVGKTATELFTAIKEGLKLTPGPFYLFRGGPGLPLHGRRPTSKIGIPFSQRASSEDEERLMREGIKKFTPFGRIVKAPRQKKRAMAYIKELKQLGRQAGEELYQEQRAKKDLESRVTGIIAIVGLGLSGFFFSSNITGNVVGNLSSVTTNWIGIILFFVGLVAGFSWVRGKKPHLH